MKEELYTKKFELSDSNYDNTLNYLNYIKFYKNVVNKLNYIIQNRRLMNDTEFCSLANELMYISLSVDDILKILSNMNDRKYKNTKYMITDGGGIYFAACTDDGNFEHISNNDVRNMVLSKEIVILEDDGVDSYFQCENYESLEPLFKSIDPSQVLNENSTDYEKYVIAEAKYIRSTLRNSKLENMLKCIANEPMFSEISLVNSPIGDMSESEFSKEIEKIKIKHKN